VPDLLGGCPETEEGGRPGCSRPGHSERLPPPKASSPPASARRLSMGSLGMTTREHSHNGGHWRW
jgi:hypothetical protein